MLFTRRNAAKALGGFAALAALPRAASAQDIGNVTPPPAFIFSVNFRGSPDTDAVAFQEVSGMTVDMDLITQDGGGDNRYLRRLPKSAKRRPIILKRGRMAADGAFVKWCRSILEAGPLAPGAVDPRDIDISLLDADGVALRSWQFRAVTPLKWDIDAFESDRNNIVVEKVELSYTTVRRSV